MQKAAIQLDRLRLIENHPNSKFLVPRTIRWIEDGPLSKKYEKNLECDFLNHDFHGSSQIRKFVSCPLSDRSKAKIARKLKELSSEIQAASELDLAVEKNLRQTSTLLIAFRDWTPAILKKFAR